MNDDLFARPAQLPPAGAAAREVGAVQASADGGEADLIARVKARVLAMIAREPKSSPYTTVRTGHEGWEEVAPGVQRKLLSAQVDGQPSLWRLASGATVPGHRHDVDEECLVLEGTVRIGADLVLHPGDYHLAPRGSAHPPVSSDEGALVYLRGAPQLHEQPQPDGAHA